MAERYDPVAIEKKWQARWEQTGLYRVTEDPARQKYYALVMFPYTSGDLHIGHWYNYGPADAHARYKRMCGYNVLEPIGFDAFGLPAENAAIRSGIHPFQWTMRNIENMRRQLRSIGAMYDWGREVVTCLPEYYKWTEWLFLQLYKHGLAYKAKAAANWCSGCATVLANEQVVEGTCERCHTPVVRRELEQWFFRITRYADELLEDLDGLEWPERVVNMQRNWIGKSYGAEIVFRSEAGDAMPVFTTRPDTVYGVTFMVLAPEHPLVERLTTPDRRADVETYVDMTRKETEIERLSTEREKTGVFTGAYAVNPLNGERVPIWIADYVLLTYGTGTVMGVPAHDERDFAFAKKYGLPIPVVIAPYGWQQGEELTEAYTDEGMMVNSGPFNGMPSSEGYECICDYLEEQGMGGRKVTYRLRDWLVSRQRYWGAPIPIIYCDKCGEQPVPEDQLPVLLPEDAEFRPTGESPLKYHRGFYETTCPQCGGPARRETDTMDTFVCSSWYFLRYANAHYEVSAADPAAVRYWLPVDQYMGGVEHAVMHLLYARFFTKALRDVGLIDFGEPFLRLANQGIILGEDNEKMSKSRGNVVNPDDYVQRLGADTVRAFLMFLGPWDQGGSWNSQGIGGISRFLNRVWNQVQATIDQGEAGPKTNSERAREVRRLTHKTIKRVTEDIEKFRFNTMLAALMEFSNGLQRVQEAGPVGGAAWREAMKTILLLLAPTVPHFAEDLWEQLGNPYSIHNQAWPKWDPDLAADELVTVVVQVNGKVRDRLTVPADADEASVREQALASEKVRRFLGDGAAPKVVYVPGRLVNIVTGRKQGEAG
ncbi:MAG: leucine--tRNA ligase [Bacteroidetes bacterium]|nr:leucine--tRNA ligase [Bacteroidota bacterium]MCL5027145.1 leucine--tRNA ligase [Chloroflexota bacterium]